MSESSTNLHGVGTGVAILVVHVHGLGFHVEDSALALGEDVDGRSTRDYICVHEPHPLLAPSARA